MHFRSETGIISRVKRPRRGEVQQPKYQVEDADSASEAESAGKPSEDDYSDGQFKSRTDQRKRKRTGTKGKVKIPGVPAQDASTAAIPGGHGPQDSEPAKPSSLYTFANSDFFTYYNNREAVPFGKITTVR